jgi:RNA polymerase sigma factor (sigma-70 family)
MTRDPWSVAYCNKGLAGEIARKFLGRGLSQDDLFQEGLLGLHRAAREFDPSRGVPFSAFARFHLLHAMRVAVYHGGRGVRRTRRGWVAADPFDAAAPEREAPDDSPVLDHDERERLRLAVDALPETWRRIVVDRYLADPPRPQKEIAADLGVTTTRVCQVERKALDRLASILSPTGEP